MHTISSARWASMSSKQSEKQRLNITVIEAFDMTILSKRVYTQKTPIVKSVLPIFSMKMDVLPRRIHQHFVFV